MYKERITVLPTLNKLISIVSMLLLSMPISGQTLEEKLEELGINMSRLTDMSDLNDIVIPEPNLAIINITGTDKYPSAM